MPTAGSEASGLLEPSKPRDRADLPHLLEALSSAADASLEDHAFDADPEIRALAVALLSARGTATDEMLASALEDESPEVAAAAAECLADRRSRRAADLLGETLIARPDRAGPVALALETLGDPGTEDLLWQCVDDAEPAVRIALVRALGASGGPRSIARLVARLDDDGDGVRREALRTLARIRERYPQAVTRDALPPAAP